MCVRCIEMCEDVQKREIVYICMRYKFVRGYVWGGVLRVRVHLRVRVRVRKLERERSASASARVQLCL